MTDDGLGQRVRSARIRMGWSQDELAAKIGTTQSTIERIENGGSLRSRFRHEAAAALGIIVLTPAPIDTAGSYVPPPQFLGERDLKVFSSVEGGPGEMTVFSTDPYEIVQRPWYVDRDPDAFGVFLTGDSMEPVYEAGEIIIVSPRAPLVKGREAVFTAEPIGGDFRASLKRYRGQTTSHWLAKQFNPEREIEFERDLWRKAFRVLGSFDG